MINSIPFLGWMISAVCTVSLAIPFWLCWSVGGIGETYFYFVPEQFQTIPFWRCVGLFIVISILKGTLIPKLFSVSNSQEVKK